MSLPSPSIIYAEAREGDETMRRARVCIAGRSDALDYRVDNGAANRGLCAKRGARIIYIRMTGVYARADASRATLSLNFVGFRSGLSGAHGG